MLTVDGRSKLPRSPLARRYGGMDTFKQMNGVLQENNQHHRPMWIITGPAGCGKSTVAGYLAKELSIPYIEGDDVSDLGIWFRFTRLMIFDAVSFCIQQGQNVPEYPSHGH